MIRTTFLLLATGLGTAFAAPHIDEDALGKSLGGWDGKTATYALSGSNYRTYKPEVSPTPDGGLFVSIRIDHLRGVLSSNDHAVLEITISPNGQIASAQSTLALQGLSISSDLIRGSASAGAQVGGVGAAVKIGGDLVADLSSKLLREKIVEAGRVSFPAALRHNYNQLYQAIRTEDGKPVVPAAAPTPGAPAAPAKEPEKPASPEPAKPTPVEPPKPAEGSELKMRAFGK
ncbi:MAG: hypothetical protein WCH40_00315 [Verrucomicrobiales bacterium]